VEKKVRTEKEEIVIPLEDLSPIAHPLAQKKLLKKLHKTIKKGSFPFVYYILVLYACLSAAKQRQVKRGVKEVVKGIRKGEKGSVWPMCCRFKLTFRVVRLLVLAANISPIDIISHLPVMSEDAGIPYVFVTSKEELGHACFTKRPTSCVMVCPDQKKKPKKKEGEDDKDDDYKELYDECVQEVEKLDQKILF
jgi:H/ACA ribonucleoprotein complex subunit 2